MSKMKPKVKSNKIVRKKVFKKKMKPKVTRVRPTEEPLAEPIEDNASDRSDKSSDDESDNIVNYKNTLNNLKETDSEFYEFLQQNDKQLLDFDLSEDEEEEEEEEKEDGLDSDSEGVEIKDKISNNQIDEWSEKLKEKSDIVVIKTVVRWFRRAVEQTSGQSEGQLISTDAFNGIINVCLFDLLPAIQRLLKLPQITSNEWSNDVRSIDPTKSRHWKKVGSVMKTYITDVIKMVAIVSEDSLKASLLRHVLYLVPFVIRFPHLIKRALKQAIVLWSESNETNRILAFICILRLTRTQEQSMMSFILKKLYISYIKNCKFTNEDNKVVINFMKLSLIELYSLDPIIAYQHSFVFIRQLAINLRTAMTLKKKESFKSVYNWQFLHSIQLWTQLLYTHNTVEELKPLICPLINVIIGTIRLIPSPKFFPMRFHLIEALIKLSEETNTFIPILPLITEVFEHLDTSKKSSDNKPINLNLVIKVSQMKSSDSEYRNAVINKVYDLILHYLSTQSHRISFPELVFMSVIKIRKFLKGCKSPQNLQSIKQLVEKIEENSNFVSDKRKSVEFGVADTLAVNSWERQLQCDGTPLNAFYNQRKRLQSDNTEQKSISDTDLANESMKVEKSGQQTSGAHKRKSSDGQNNKKRTKKSKKRRNSKEKKPKTNLPSDSFDLNQTLNISSDESD